MSERQLTQSELNILGNFVQEAGDTGRDTRSDYYQQLSDWGYDYGDLARGVADHSTFSGRMANAFMASMAKQNGNSINFDKAQKIGIELMGADLAAREAELGEFTFSDGLDARERYENHKEVFKDNGISIDYWTAAAPIEFYRENYKSMGFDSAKAAENYIFEEMKEVEGWYDIVQGADLMVRVEFPAWELYVKGDITWRDAAKIFYWQANVAEAGILNASYIASGNGSPYEPPKCFVAGAPILRHDGSSVAVEDVRPGDVVAAFDETASGRGALAGRAVVRLYTNTTQELIRLDFPDGRDALHVTPGHAFMDETGRFTKVGDRARGSRDIMVRKLGPDAAQDCIVGAGSV